jgi:dipeptidyl aminopeptidase/acylaminoacyl peptidase
MTAVDRFERDLPMDLENLARPSTPDYLNDILGQTATTRQRPAWTFPERWLPMADIASRPAFVPRMPLRLIAVAFVIIALLVAGAVFVGSQQQTKLPPQFGVAGNGLVAYASNGDIYTADAVTGAATAVVTGPEIDEEPFFSPDGTKLAFLRQAGSYLRWDVVVAAVDGSNQRVITTEPIWNHNEINWAPDSRSLIFNSDTGQLRRLDASRTAAAEVFAENVAAPAQLRPPNGDQFLYDQPEDIEGAGIWIKNIDGSDARPLFQLSGVGPTASAIGNYGWSPDGSMIAFNQQSDDGASRIFVMSADGSDVRQLTDAPGLWHENDFRWSPDGTHLAFNRWQYDAATDQWLIRPIGIVSIEGGPVLDAGPVPGSDGAIFDYSPDGSTIMSVAATVYQENTANTSEPIAIDAATGEYRTLTWPAGSMPSWQRTALEP